MMVATVFMIWNAQPQVKSFSNKHIQTSLPNTSSVFVLKKLLFVTYYEVLNNAQIAIYQGPNDSGHIPLGMLDLAAGKVR